MWIEKRKNNYRMYDRYTDLKGEVHKVSVAMKASIFRNATDRINTGFFGIRLLLGGNLGAKGYIFCPLIAPSNSITEVKKTQLLIHKIVLQIVFRFDQLIRVILVDCMIDQGKDRFLRNLVPIIDLCEMIVTTIESLVNFFFPLFYALTPLLYVCLRLSGEAYKSID